MKLKPESSGRTEMDLSYGGHLLLEHDLPFLMIYRNMPGDTGTARLAQSAVSYLITDSDHPAYFGEVLSGIAEKMSARFGSFIFIEIYSGPSAATDFIIRGPVHKLPVSIQVLKQELSEIAGEEHQRKPFSVKVKTTKNRSRSGEALLSIEDLKNQGGTYLGLEIPPVYRDEKGELYPLYFKKFRKDFTNAVQKAVFEFIRIQTPCDIHSFSALGQRKIQEKLFEIDTALTRIQNSYQFLLLIAPVNIQSIREAFFSSNYEVVKPYHYRLIPVNPDILKRELYNLRIDEIDDPSLAFLYEEKREEIDQELTMLKERGTRNFFFSSLRLYKGIEKRIIQEAKLVLENIEENSKEEEEKEVDAWDFEKLTLEEFDFFRKQVPDFQSRVHIRKDINIIMVSNGELYIPQDYRMTRAEAAALIQHEIGTHVLTYFNGSKQPLTQLTQGFAAYDSLQEGLAVMSEYLTGSLTANRLRKVAGRVVAGEALLNDAGFREIFYLLHFTYGFSKKPAFNITSRMFQGSGFLKDIVYLRGLVELKEYLYRGGDLKCLLAGKFALDHVPIMKELTDRGIVAGPVLTPRYFESSGFQARMDLLRKGISLSKMVTV